ncbi:unnamed protein product, partial [Ilex paraguariensis]
VAQDEGDGPRGSQAKVVTQEKRKPNSDGEYHSKELQRNLHVGQSNYSSLNVEDVYAIDGVRKK